MKKFVILLFEFLVIPEESSVKTRTVRVLYESYVTRSDSVINVIVLPLAETVGTVSEYLAGSSSLELCDTVCVCVPGVCIQWQLEECLPVGLRS